MGLASLISRSPWSGAHFTFWTPWQGGCPATTWADARCARGSPNPTERPPWSEPKTGRSDGTDTDPPCSSPPPPTAQSLFPPLRAPVVSPLLVLQQIYTILPGHRFPRAGALFPLESQAPLLQPVVMGDVPLESRLPPGAPHTAAASRRTRCAAATPHGAFEVTKRLEDNPHFSPDAGLVG